MKTLILTSLAVLTLSFSALAGNKGENPKASTRISNWVSNNISYPETAIENREEGTVYVAIVVENGEITLMEVIEGVSESLDKEVLSMIRSLPVSELGVNTNENRTYILPVKFDLK